MLEKTGIFKRDIIKYLDGINKEFLSIEDINAMVELLKVGLRLNATLNVSNGEEISASYKWNITDVK